MAIKNYTTTIDSFDSIGKIQGALAKHGARKIVIDYDENGRPSSVAFGMPLNGKMIAFLLPANVEGVERVFKEQKVKGGRDQAEKTAWKNVHDWIMAQMAFVESGNAQMAEVFLPYVTDGKGNTMYSVCLERGCPPLISDGSEKTS